MSYQREFGDDRNLGADQALRPLYRRGQPLVPGRTRPDARISGPERRRQIHHHIERDPAEWLDKTLADIPSDRIAEIVLTRPCGSSRHNRAIYKVSDLPSGRELKDESAVNGLASTLAGLTLVDALPAKSSQPPGEDQLSNGQMLCTGVGSGGDFLDVFLNSILEHDSLDDLG